MEIKTFPSIYLRRHPDSNWGWRICSPLPYRLAMSPRYGNPMDRSNHLSFQVIRPSFKYSMRCMLKSTIKEMDLICYPSFDLAIFIRKFSK